MAFFGTTIETLETVKPHPNADSLELAYMKGLNFQLSVNKDKHKAGDKVVYFPIDSVIPEPILISLGLSGKLSGAAKNRLKVGKKIRGEWAEGLAVNFSEVWSFISEKEIPSTIDEEVWNKQLPAGGNDTNGGPIDTTVLTKVLQVLKYEMPEDFAFGNASGALPAGLSKYDIEGCQREVDYFNTLLDTPVVIMEKIEGQNFCAHYDALQYKFYVCSRSMTKHEPTELQIEQGNVCTFWKNAEQYDLKNQMIAYSKANGLKSLSLYAEQYGPGIQKNIYGIGRHQLAFFDIKRDGEWVSFDEAYGIWGTLGLKFHIAPVLAVDTTLREVLAGQNINDYATGKSQYNQQILREGVVIKPMVEVHRFRGGRLILKHRSLEYLEKTGL